MKKRGVFLFLVLILAGCMGCGGLGMLSNTETFIGQDSIALPIPRTDILEVIEEVGKSMGFNISGRGRDTISMSSTNSPLGLLLIGQMSQSFIDVSSKDDGKRLDIQIVLSGNFGTGGQQEASRILEEFKKKLAKTLNGSI